MRRKGTRPQERFRRWRAPVLFLALMAPALGPGGVPEDPPLAVVDAWLVDGSGEAPRVGTVIVRDGRIEAVGPRLPIPAGARVIAGKGSTLLPGFFDLHEHVPYATVRGLRGDWIKNLHACLAAGVTTVVDFGRDPESFGEVRRILSSGRFPAPHVLMAARFAAPSGHGAELGRDWFSSLAVTPFQAETAFARIVQEKPDALKIFSDGWRYGVRPDMADMPEETVQRLAQLARDHGIPTLSHTVTLEKAKADARSGVGVLAHAISDQPVDEALIGLLLENRTCYAPTMAVYEPTPPDYREPWSEELLEPAVRRRIPALRPDSPSAATPSPASLERWKHILANTRALHEAGVRVALGTDAGVVGTHHGWAVLRELQLLVEAGLTPLEALRAATRTAADCLGVLPDRGTIEAGKRADLVLIDGKPHENIAEVWKIDRVFLDGREVSRDKLIAAIQDEDPITPDVAPAATWIDDFESGDGRSRTGSSWRADFESGQLATAVAHGRAWRSAQDRCLSALVRFAANEEPFARLSLPLSRGEVAAVDAAAFEGVEFEARGDGPVRFLVETLEIRDGDDFGFEFEAGPEWTKVRVPFQALTRGESRDHTGWSPSRLLSVGFRLSGPPGAGRFLEIDNLKFWAGPDSPAETRRSRGGTGFLGGMPLRENRRTAF